MDGMKIEIKTELDDQYDLNDAMKIEFDDYAYEPHKPDVDIKLEDADINLVDVKIKLEDVEIKLEDVEIKPEDVDIVYEDVKLEDVDINLETEDITIKTGLNSDEEIIEQQSPNSFNEIHFQDLDIEQIYRCDKCHFTSDNFCDYQAHDNQCFSDLKACTIKKRKKDLKKCEYCKKTYSVSHLKKHIQTIHENPKRVDCPICGKVFNRAHDLPKHMNSHSEMKLYQCGVCQESFATAGGLKNHYKTHKRQFKCETCLMKFNRQEELTKHAVIHDIDMKFQCNICDLEFTKPYYLSVHMRLHTGEGLFKCTPCSLVFPLSSMLSKHFTSKSHSRRVDLMNMKEDDIYVIN